MLKLKAHNVLSGVLQTDTTTKIISFELVNIHNRTFNKPRRYRILDNFGRDRITSIQILLQSEVSTFRQVTKTWVQTNTDIL